MSTHKNIDEAATEDCVSAMVDLEAAARQGFRDGFAGYPARNISPFVDQMRSYLDAFKEGRDHRDQVEEVTVALKMDMNQVMRHAFDYFYKNGFKKEDAS